ncbi:MAG: ribosome biogenesis GTPase [Candidatus Azotimanducaceae bacterium]|jgi:ribosome biogenesis GTPase
MDNKLEDITTLKQLGWKNFFQQQVDIESSDIPARVIRQDRSGYQLMSESGKLIGSLPGKSRLETPSKADLPTIGDWVLVTPADKEHIDQVIIQKTLERLTKFSRKEAGEKFEEQVVAANIDTIFIVTGLDDNFNVKRIERYLLLTWASGATPVIVLNKLDMCADIDKKIEQVKRIAVGTVIIAASAINEEGVDKLRSWITEGTTVAVLGSSGVGKSTLINCLLGYSHFKTGDVRETDSKGRHTTTHRELCMIEGGGLIIDTPGMREIQFWVDKDSAVTSYLDVDGFSQNCKFHDCSHETEPSCAVKKAIEDGDLSLERFTSYLKFQKEIAFFHEQQQSASAKVEKKNDRKRFSKLVRNRPIKRD